MNNLAVKELIVMMNQHVEQPVHLGEPLGRIGHLVDLSQQLSIAAHFFSSVTQSGISIPVIGRPICILTQYGSCANVIR